VAKIKAKEIKISAKKMISVALIFKTCRNDKSLSEYWDRFATVVIIVANMNKNKKVDKMVLKYPLITKRFRIFKFEIIY
jgi:hypothetical protein